MHRVYQSKVSKSNASISNVESTLTGIKQHTNGSNDDPYNTIQRQNLYKYQVMKEPTYFHRTIKNIFLTITLCHVLNCWTVWQQGSETTFCKEKRICSDQIFHKCLLIIPSSKFCSSTLGNCCFGSIRTYQTMIAKILIDLAIQLDV